MPKKRVCVTVDRALLDEFKQLAGKDANLSAALSEALRHEVHRLEMIAYLDEMEREHPISPEGRAEGERLWQTAVLSWTQVPCPHSRKTNKRSASP